MTTQYKIQKDVAGYNGYGLQFSDQKYSATLGAGTDTTVAVPLTGTLGAALNSVNKFLAIVTIYNATGEGEVWCANNTAASAPVGATFAATASDLIVQNRDYARWVKAGDVLHFLSPVADTDICVMFYAMQAD
jgi:hypothetical protein